MGDGVCVFAFSKAGNARARPHNHPRAINAPPIPHTLIHTHIRTRAASDLATSVVYTAPQAPTPIPADYVAAGQAICRKRVAVAAYRLASLLEYVFTAGALRAEL